MITLKGEIAVANVMKEARRERQLKTLWRERGRRADERTAEEEAIKAYWNAPEGDRDAVVRKYAEAFDRMKAKRRMAIQIEAQERALVDASMRRAGYVVRAVGDWPRYVRP